jgi:hypothetical protein
LAPKPIIGEAIVVVGVRQRVGHIQPKEPSVYFKDRIASTKGSEGRVDVGDARHGAIGVQTEILSHRKVDYQCIKSR